VRLEWVEADAEALPFADGEFDVVTSAFGAVFLAELGDKTQLAAVTLTASTRQPLAVFVGASTALVAVTLLGVVAGAALADVLTETFGEHREDGPTSWAPCGHRQVPTAGPPGTGMPRPERT